MKTMDESLLIFCQFLSDRGINPPTLSAPSLSSVISVVYDQLDDDAMKDIVAKAIEARDAAAQRAYPSAGGSASGGLSASMGAWGDIIDAMREETAKRQNRGDIALK
jgi:hypothetical protein